jgi:hypothetical protein
LHQLNCHKTLLASLLLLVYLFSANALVFGIHAAEEMILAADHGATTCASLGPGEVNLSDVYDHDHSDAGHGKDHHGDGFSDSHHTHDLADGPIASISKVISSTSLRFFEPFAWFPTVFLDRFIPPQNLA